MRLADDDLVDEAQQAILNHSWVEHMPSLTSKQLAELLPVLASVMAPKRRLPSVPKEYRKPPQKPAKVGKGSQSQGRTLVAARSGGLCEICALAPAREWHHRKNRSQGGTWAASNGMHLCAADHAWITENPAQAARNGWGVRSHEDPAVVPCYRRGLWVLLKDDGSVELFEEVA